MSISTSTSTQHSEINVTPLIDVLLVLLIIFMVIVPVTPRGLDSQVPQSTASTEASLGPVVLRLTSSDADPSAAIRYELDGHALRRDELCQALSARLRLRAQPAVIVTASRQLNYSDIAAVVGIAKTAGAATIALDRL